MQDPHALGSAASAHSRSASYRPTLTTIAQRAGLSVATVSKVLNNRPDVAETTRRRVQEMLDHYGHPRRDPDQPWVSRSTLVDLLMIDMDDPWASQVLSAFEVATREVGLGIVPSSIGSLTVPDDWIRRTVARGSRGIIFVFADLAENQHSLLQAAAVPYVLVGQGQVAPDTVSAVKIDYHAGARLGTEHLLELGHRRIGLIVGSQGLLYNESRFQGYRDALHATGVRTDRALVRWSTKFSERAGHDETLALFGLDDPPTAIVASSDVIAVGVYAALRELGLRPGSDVSVVGFDGRPEATWLEPALTTISQPLPEIAEGAIELLTGSKSDTTRTVQGTLVVRDSTAAPNQTEQQPQRAKPDTAGSTGRL